MTAQVTAQVTAFCRESQPAKAIVAEQGLKHTEKSKGRR